MGGRGVWCVDAGVSLVSPCFPQPPPPPAPSPPRLPRLGSALKGRVEGRLLILDQFLWQPRRRTESSKSDLGPFARSSSAAICPR